MNDLEQISNPILDKLPDHLKQYILPQKYERYSPEDQAVWRYVMRKNANYLPHVAHQSYLQGLKETGIDIESLPSMYGMNRILRKIGWAAVAVNGLIPSAPFMEFQAYNVLVIASDIRLLENIEYTPTPDIIHESAGHAPIIAIPEYAEYLRRFGELGAKAISSDDDRQLFDAVRELSILKERPDTSAHQINRLEEKIVELQRTMTNPSELQLIKNLHWWTIEYGLIGSVDEPKIYGAGLLSSIGESKWCLSDNVRKIPFSIHAAYQAFDVTQPQPQLFVTPNFAYLSEVLNEFADTMAVRCGGKTGVEKLIESKQLGTIELSTGLQISGTFTNMVLNEKNQPAYIQTTGPTALSYREKELIGHSTSYHSQGYGTALGKLKGINLAIEDMSPRDLTAYRIMEGQQINLHFEGEIIVKGRVITGTRNVQGKIMLIALENCTVTCGDEVFFQPEYGIYDLAIGTEIISAFAGPADVSSFDLTDFSLELTQESTISGYPPSPRIDVYQQLRDIRSDTSEGKKFDIIVEKIIHGHQYDWLILLEAYEIATHRGHTSVAELYSLLTELQKSKPEVAHLIGEGLELLEK